MDFAKYKYVIAVAEPRSISNAAADKKGGPLFTERAASRRIWR